MAGELTSFWLARGRGVVQGAGSSPLTILGANLLAWWTADDPATFDMVGSQVTAWRDKIGGRSLTQGVSSARPLYSPTGFNGAPCLTFDGQDDRLGMSGAHGLPQGGTICEAWGLVDQASQGVAAFSKIAIAWGSSANSVRRILGRHNSADVNRPSIWGGTGAAESQSIDNSSDFSGRHYVRGIWDTASISIGMDGGALQGASNALADTGANGISIGSTLTPSAFWVGSVREIIITNLITDTTVRDALSTYFNARK